MTDTLDRLNLQTEQLRMEMTGLNRLADSFGIRLVNAFAGAAIHGRKLSDVLRSLALSLSQTALTSALRPIGQMVGGLFGSFIGSARGNVFAGGRVTPFASGGIVNSPTLFPMRGGTGLMGEAGPEAILPLRRGPGGRLGVETTGGGPAPQPATRIVNVLDPAIVGDYLATPAGERLIVNVIRRNRGGLDA